MTFETGFADPRSYIRELRNRGINVLDEWIRKDDVHFKRYWIKKTDDAL
jgi:ABC-type siderophore export system fused ATPase/permease subunit